MRFGTARFRSSRFGTGEDGEGGVPRPETSPPEIPDALEATVLPPRDVSERERIEGYLKPPFRTPIRNDGSYAQTDVSAFWATFAALAEAMSEVNADVLGSKFIDYAYGQSLDEHGKKLRTPRKTGEGDPKYRLRLKAEKQRLVRVPTLDNIREMVATLLGFDATDIGIDQPFEEAPAIVEIFIENRILQEAAVDTDELSRYVDKFRAGGVKVYITPTTGFRTATEEEMADDTLDPEAGYGEAPYVGRFRVDRR